MKRIVFFVMWFITLLPETALAYRPFYTEDAGVAGLGIFQTEVSLDYFKWKNGDIDKIFLLVSPIWGPTENVELSTEYLMSFTSLLMVQPREALGT